MLIEAVDLPSPLLFELAVACDNLDSRGLMQGPACYDAAHVAKGRQRRLGQSWNVESQGIRVVAVSVSGGFDLSLFDPNVE